MPLVVLNRAGPDAGERVPTDGGTADDEAPERKALLEGRDLAVVEDGRPPQGVDALSALGRRLYRPVAIGRDAAS
jgi:hypothetical protein